MNLTLKIDEEGTPYILLESVGVNIDDQVLELFIKRAYKQGVEVVNKSKRPFTNDYANIILRKKKK